MQWIFLRESYRGGVYWLVTSLVRASQPGSEESSMVFTVRDFCKFAGISQSLYFALKRRGEGPRETRIAGRVLIAKATAEEWLRSKEQVAA